MHTQLLDIGDDAIGQVFSHLDARSLGRVGRVCRLFDRISRDDFLWMNLCGVAGFTPPESELPTQGHWKNFYTEYLLRRSFDEKRCHPNIKLSNKNRTATVPVKSTNTGYKGVMLNKKFPMRGVTEVHLQVKYLDSGDCTDHVSIGIANASFNTKTNCGEGWFDANAGMYDKNLVISCSYFVAVGTGRTVFATTLALPSAHHLNNKPMKLFTMVTALDWCWIVKRAHCSFIKTAKCNKFRFKETISKQRCVGLLHIHYIDECVGTVSVCDSYA